MTLTQTADQVVQSCDVAQFAAAKVQFVRPCTLDVTHIGRAECVKLCHDLKPSVLADGQRFVLVMDDRFFQHREQRSTGSILVCVLLATDFHAAKDGSILFIASDGIRLCGRYREQKDALTENLEQELRKALNGDPKV